MTLQSFIDKYKGKGIDWDSHYGFQCVDLYRQYVQEVLQVPQSPGVTGAKDIWDTYLTQYYDRIINTPDGVPEPGDIMIWGSDYGQYGHVAIVTEANKDTFTCFSQNDPLGALCGLKTYSKWGLGWLHPKPKDSMYRGYDLSNSDSMKIAINKLCDIMDGKYITSEEHQRIINELDSKSTEQATQYAKKEEEYKTKISALDEALLSLQTTEHSWETEADKYQRLFKVTQQFLSDNDIQVTSESTGDEIKGALSTATRSEEIANLYAAIQTRLILSDTTPEAVLGALDNLEEEYNKKIASLKKKTGEILSLELFKYIIKIYGK